MVYYFRMDDDRVADPWDDLHDLGVMSAEWASNDYLGLCEETDHRSTSELEYPGLQTCICGKRMRIYVRE